MRISPRSINRLANKNGIKTFRCIKRPNLNITNRKKRLHLAKKLLRRPYLIDLIVFTDEKKFMSNNDSRIEYCNRLPETAYQEQHLSINKMSSSAGDLNIWGYIGSFGKGNFNFC